MPKEEQYSWMFLVSSVGLLWTGCGTAHDPIQTAKPDIQKHIEFHPKQLSGDGVVSPKVQFQYKPVSKKLRAYSAEEQSAIRAKGLEYLNQLRSDAGMILYAKETHLDTAAYNHAHYLMLNNAFGHYESSSDDGFTGVTPSDRAVYAGYPHRYCGENLSGGNSSVYDSIDGLFSAIYHRFGFLDFSYNEIGIGADSSTSHAYGNAYNYDMGLSQLRVLCEGDSYSGDNSYYTGVCADSDFRIEATVYENAIQANAFANPAYVIWPYDGQRDVLPVFYEESPDPLPDCSVSGYPLSISFNDVKTGAITMLSFELYYDLNGSEVTDTRLLDASSDPNHHFSSKEFALFPLSRLVSDTRYKAQVQYTENGLQKSRTWHFKTRALPYPYYTIHSSGVDLDVKSGQTYLFYMPPADCNDTAGGYSLSYGGDISVNSDIYDQNTYQITVTGSSGSVSVSPANGRDFTLHLSSEDNALYSNDPINYPPGLQLDTSDGTLKVLSPSQSTQTVIARISDPNDVIIIDQKYQGTSFSWTPPATANGPYKYYVKIYDPAKTYTAENEEQIYAAGTVEVIDGNIISRDD